LGRESFSDRESCELNAVMKIELRHDVSDVRIDGSDAQVDEARDFFFGHADGDVPEDFELAFRE